MAEEKRSAVEKIIGELEQSFCRQAEDKYYRFVLKRIERPLLKNVLKKTGGNQSEAARILGINRNTLHSKIKKLGIEAERWEEV